MKFRIACVILPAMLVAACGQGGSGGNGAASAAPVAAVKPPAGQNWVDMVARTAEGGYRMGNPEAPVKLIEYGSRACPYCGKFDAEGVPALKSNYIASGKVSYEFRDYPVHGALDIAPILLGNCVDPQVFFPLLDQMMAAQPQLLANEQAVSRQAQQMQGRPPAEIATFYAEKLGYLDFVKQRGVTEAKARACLNDPAGYTTLTRNTENANNKFNVSGTPTFILNGNTLPSTNDWATLEPQLKAAGA